MMQVTREAIAADVDDLVGIGCGLVRGTMGLMHDREKIKKVIEVAISSKAQKLLVATEGGKIIGAMLTISNQFMFAEKMHAYIVGVHSTRSGAADAMIQLTMDWIKTRKAIQICCYSMTVKTKLDEILLNYNFEPTGSMLVWRRYGILQ